MELLLMEPKSVLERRKQLPQTLYNAEAWERELQHVGLIQRFAKIPEGLRSGFSLDFPSILTVQSPPNRDSISEYQNEFNLIIQKELLMGRYISPFTADVLEQLIGPFQSLPLSIILKPEKLGKFQVIQISLSCYQSAHHSQTHPSIHTSMLIIFQLLGENLR
jgi:hypothetical protein